MTKLKTVKKLLYKSGILNAFLSYFISAKVAHCPDFLRTAVSCFRPDVNRAVSLDVSHIVHRYDAIPLLDKLFHHFFVPM